MENCIFCKIIKGEVPSYKVYEDKLTYAFLDIHPASEFHTLVIPKAHSENIFDVSDSDLVAVTFTVKKIVDIYNRKLGIKNVQIVNSSGAEAQQDVFHLHFHIVPRQIGDGQDIKWQTHSELVKEFPQMLERLK
jgi:histidine triad (HIT) family protein